VLGGVCGGLATRLGLASRTVRIAAVVTLALGGLGIVLYMALWVAVPATGESESVGARVLGDRRELQVVLAVSTAMVAVVLALQEFGLSGLGVPTWSLLVASIGGLTVWRGASAAETIRLRETLNAAPVIGTTPQVGWRRMAVRAVIGAALILYGVAELSRVGNLSGAAFGVLIGTAAFAGGFLVLFAPWWVRTLRELSTERRERVRAEERADMASHVHDSVLQTLALVQKAAGENQILSLSFVAAVSKLAREIRKERRAEGTSAHDAGTYPIVMDAAFGSLDQDYQEAVSRALAKMAPQLVVLVSKSQGLGRVVTELMPYVSHLGIIETCTTAPVGVADDIELEGMSYPYIRAAESDHSELKVIK